MIFAKAQSRLAHEAGAEPAAMENVTALADDAISPNMPRRSGPRWRRAFTAATV
jgi:hypothetical protein